MEIGSGMYDCYCYGISINNAIHKNEADILHRITITLLSSF